MSAISITPPRPATPHGGHRRAGPAAAGALVPAARADDRPGAPRDHPVHGHRRAAADVLQPGYPEPERDAGGNQLQHWLGTDQEGRDIFSRLLYGGRVDLQVAFLAVLFPFILGTILGSVAGYFGGWVDLVIMRMVDIVVAFPFFVLIIALVFVLGPGERSIYIAITAVGWVSYARLSAGVEAAGGRQLGCLARSCASRCSGARGGATPPSAMSSWPPSRTPSRGAAVKEGRGGQVRRRSARRRRSAVPTAATSASTRTPRCSSTTSNSRGAPASSGRWAGSYARSGSCGSSRSLRRCW